MTKRISYSVVMKVYKWLDEKDYFPTGREIQSRWGLTHHIAYRLRQAYLDTRCQ